MSETCSQILGGMIGTLIGISIGSILVWFVILPWLWKHFPP